MSEGRKKTGLGFWCTIFTVVLLAYPLSFGPVCWVSQRTGLGCRAIALVYRPIVWQLFREDAILRDAVLWYSRAGIRGDEWPFPNDSIGLVWLDIGPWHIAENEPVKPIAPNPDGAPESN